MRTRLISLAALGLGFFPTLPADAQAQSDAVPADVVEAILRNFDGPEDVRLVPGARIPSDIASAVSLPPGTTVIAVLRSYKTRVIGAVPGEPDSVRLWFIEQFHRRGYLPQEMLGRFRPAFAPAEPSLSRGGYCGGGRLFEVSAKTVTPGRVEFVLSVQQAPACGQPNHGRGDVTSWTSGYGTAPPDLPLLRLPRSVDAAPVCSRAHQERASREITEPVSTTRPTAELLTHFDRQLDSLGWTRTAGVMSSWAKPDSAGRDVHLVVLVQPGPGGVDCRLMQMEAHRSSR